MLFVFIFSVSHFFYALSPRLQTYDSAKSFQEEVILEGECDVILEELSLFFQDDKRKSFEAYLKEKQSLLRQGKNKVRNHAGCLLNRDSEKDQTCTSSHLRDEQNPNPRLAGLREMFSNSTDSMGGYIGRFGSGVFS